MAHSKQALKRLKTSKLKHIANRAKKSMYFTAEKNLRAAVEANDAEKAAEMLKACESRLDKNVKAGLYHKNKVARKKSQLQKLVASMA